MVSLWDNSDMFTFGNDHQFKVLGVAVHLMNFYVGWLLDSA